MSNNEEIQITSENAKLIKMDCGYDIDFSTYPDDMINKDGTKNYAYVTLVMLGDSYVPGAVNLAYSLRKLNTKADLVVLVTDDVSEDGKKIMARFYDKIVEVDYIRVPNWRTQINKETLDYLSLVFTKFYIFDLVEYKKVLFIDADALVLKYPDHLFTLNTPAGTLLSNKDLLIKYGEDGGYVMPDNNRIKWYDVYCKCCSHGKVIPKKLLNNVYTNFNNSGIGAGLLLVEPKEGELDNIIKDVSYGKMRYLVGRKFRWPEQQYLTLRYAGKWHMIDIKFFGLQGYPHYSVLFGLQYAGNKPFLHTDVDVDVFINYTDFAIWYKLFNELIKQYPDFKDYKFFDASIRYTQEFIKRNKIQSRQTIDSKLINEISSKYDINKNILHNNQLEYYFLDEQLIYRPVDYTKPLFDNIDKYEYMKPIHKLDKYIPNNKYYKKLISRYKIPKTIRKLSDYDKINPIDRDEIMLQYLKCRPTSKMLILFPMGKGKKKSFIEYLELNYDIYYVKTINADMNTVHNLLYWLYDDFRNTIKIEYIDNRLSDLNISSYDNELTFIFIDNIDNNAKTVLDDKILTLINADRDIINGDDVLYMSKYFYQTIENAQIVLNDNSIDLLKHQNVNIYEDEQMAYSNLIYQTFKKWYYTDLEPLERNRIVLTGDSILYSYGIRNINELSGYVIGKIDDIADNQFDRFTHLNLIDKNTKFYFTNFSFINNKINKYSEILRQFDIENPLEVIIDPNYHMYFNGIKINLIYHLMTKKIHDHDPLDLADIIVMYFNNKELLGDRVFLDKNNRIQFNKNLNIKIDNMDNKMINKIYFNIEKYYPYNNINKNIIKELFNI